MDIIISEKSGKNKMYLQWLPDKIVCESGEARLAVYDIINLGEVNIPNGSNLQQFKWESTLPGEKHKNLPFLKAEWKNPKDIQSQWSKWKVNHTPLTLIITDTPINHDVYLFDYNISYEGAYGDYKYDIIFRAKRKDIVIKVDGNNSKSSSSKNKTTTYTIKKGDTLWKIAKNLLKKKTGKNPKNKDIKKLANQLYTDNKKVIENAAKKHKKKSSNKGQHIYPGTKLKVPA